MEERIPVEAELPDNDGVSIHVLLHVVNGLLAELEIYKDDLSPIQESLCAEKIRLTSRGP